MCCMRIQPFNKCWRAATTKETPFSPENGKKKSQFVAQISFFWVRVVSLCAPCLCLRVLDTKKDVLHTIEAIEQVFQGRNHHGGI